MMVISANFLAATPKLYLYLLPFDNINNEQAIAWLGLGFTDMLTKEMTAIEGLFLRNRGDLENIMNNRGLLLKQPRDSRNILVLGKYSRKMDEISVDMQFIDIANWEELDKREAIGSYNNVPQLNNELAEVVKTVCIPYLPEKKTTKKIYPDFTTPQATAIPRTFGERGAVITSSIDDALIELERSMDFVIGARGKPKETLAKKPVAEDEWVVDINNRPFNEPLPENVNNTVLLDQVLANLMDKPYDVFIYKPTYVYDEDEDDNMITVNMRVDYGIKGDIINDMLTSLPYTGIKQDGSLTIVHFDRENFNFPPELTKNISLGNYRAVPVIRFLDKDGIVMAIILDTPESRWYDMSSNKIYFIPLHQFSPLVDFTMGGWSLQVALEDVEIKAHYSLQMSIEEVDRISRVSLKFVPEAELGAIIFPHL
jgi:TolB-like protein